MWYPPLLTRGLLTLYLTALCSLSFAAAIAPAQEAGGLKTTTPFFKDDRSKNLPAELVSLHDQAVQYAFYKNYDKAITLFQEIITRKPDFVEARLNLAITYAYSARYAEAIAEFKSLIAAQPDYAKAYAGLGDALLDVGRAAESVAFFRQAIKLEPNNSIFLIKIGIALHDAGNYDAALAAFETAIRLQPDALAYTAKGVLLASLKRFPEAVTNFEKAVALDDSFAEAHNNLGVVWTLLGKKKRAHKYYLKAAELRSDWSYAQYNLSLSFLGRGDRKMALQHFARLKKLDAELAAKLSRRIYQNYVLDAARTEEQLDTSPHKNL